MEGDFPVTVRSISGGAELLLRIDITGEMDIAVDFGNRSFHTGKGEWDVMTRNKKNRCVFPIAPTALGYKNLEEYSPKMAIAS